MKERIVLLTIISSLLVFLYLFQNYMDAPCAIMAILGFIAVYSTYMQIAYKHRQRKQRKHPVEKNYDYKPYVTIMIPCHNEAEVIEKTIENISAIDYPLYEIIVIDDRSTDNTAEVLEQVCSKYKNLKYFSRTQDAFPGKSAVLNDALKIAKGEAILVFDADARVKSDFLKELIPALEPEQVGAVQARKVVINREQNFLTRCQDNEMALDTHFQVGRDAVKGAVELRGNGELIKRVALEDVGGWNINTITDDLDLSTRMQIKGWDVRFCPEICVYEEGVPAYIPLLKQRRRWIEGSIRRYLEHFWDVLTSKDVSKRVRLDMTAYITEFILPLWLVAELVIQSYRYVRDYSHWIQSSLVLSAIICGFFIISSSYSLKKYVKLRKRDNVKQAIITSIYMLVLWCPVAIYILFKIIFMKNTMEWGKTQHGSAKHTNEVLAEKVQSAQKEETEQLINV